MAAAAAGENGYIKYRGDSFLAETYQRSCAMYSAHVHAVYELYFCPEPLHHRCNLCGNPYEFDHAAVILLKPYSIHSIYEEDPWPEGKSWYVFSFSESTAEQAGMHTLLREMLAGSMSILYALTPEQAAYLASVLQFLFHPAYPLEESEALSIFSFFLCRLKNLTCIGQTTAIGSADYSVQRIMQYICENLSSELTAEVLSKRFSVSRSKLDRDFKASLGVTPRCFTELCRLHYAKRLLRSQKDLRISEIAQTCGFPSENYFYRFFRSHTGQTPKQYKTGEEQSSHP